MTTRNYAPRENNEGELGVDIKWWAKAHINTINSKNVNTESIKATIFNDMEVTFYFLKRNTTYKVDDVAYNKNTKNGVRLECVQGGTTATVEPEGYSTVNIGSYITDGTTKWLVCDIKDGLAYGDIIHRPILKKGYVKLNGATVQRADYPRLVKYATDNNLWTSSPTTDIWKFGQGDGRSTFVLPDYRDIFVEGGDTPSKIGAGLPNITGLLDIARFVGGRAQGAFYQGVILENVGITSGNNLGGAESYFDASRSNSIYGSSNTVQPPSIVLIPQIKY